MKLKDITKEELEVMGYDDIAYLILEESKKKMKITDLFKKVCSLRGLSDAEYEAHIADFFEILTTDKKFIMLEDGYWDLRTRHSEKLVIEEDDDEYEDIPEEEDDTEEEPEEENFYDEDSDDDTPDDDLKDFVVIDEDEEN
ncbi:TPA: DNA-directed RNA polymerase subunit delta [Candidatus Ventrenecus avicola]|nr:DNA-directed RNA polymerase subunit delta [Candidatus Ventrenecus avicola]